MPETNATPARVALTDYAVVGVILTAFAILLARITSEPVPSAPERLIGPMVAMAALTAAVWLAMVLARNVSILLGRASVRYYRDYASDLPPEWIERPARTFNNLMQLPTLFHVVGLLMLVTARADSAQVALAWLFVATRALHAVVYIAWNNVSYRFAAWISGSLVLIVLWTRFALQTSTLW